MRALSRTARATLRLELPALAPALALGAALALVAPALAQRVVATLGSGADASSARLADVLADPIAADLLGLATGALLLFAARRAERRGLAHDGSLTALLPLARGPLVRARAALVLALALAVVALRHGGQALARAALDAWPPGAAGAALGLAAQDATAALAWAGLALTLAPAGRGGALAAAALLLLGRGAALLAPLAGWGGLGACDLLTWFRPGSAAAAALVTLAAGAAVTAARARAPARSPRPVRGPEPPGVAPAFAPAYALLLALGLPLAALRPPTAPTRPGGPPAPAPLRATLWTARFRLDCDPAAVARARPLAARADALHAAVAAELGVDPLALGGPPLELTLGEAGEADLPLADPPAAAYALALRAAEALLAQEPRAAPLARWPRPLRVVQLGLARHAALTASGHAPAWSRFHAALVHARRPLRLAEAFDLELLLARRHPELAAPLGEALVEAARRAGGSDAPRRLLGAIGAEAARALEPRSGAACEALWAAILARAGLEREVLRERLMEVLETAAPPDDPRAVTLPRLHLGLDAQEEPLAYRLYAVPDLPVPPGWEIVARARRRPPGHAGGEARCVPAGGAPGGVMVFTVPSSRFHPPPWVQLGLRPLPPSPLFDVVWEEWVPPPGPP